MDTKQTHILVAVDGSKNSFRAVQYAGELLPPERSRLTLFHVLDHIQDGFWDLESHPMFRSSVARTRAWQSRQEGFIGAFMERSRTHLLERGFAEDSVQICIRKREADVARDLLQESENGYQAMILGRRGLSPLKDLILGSVAERMAGGMAVVPVCVVGERIHVDRVLIAMDGSREADRAVQFAGGALAGRKLDVLLVHVLRGGNLSAWQETGDAGGEQELALDEDTEQAFKSLEEKAWGFLEQQIRYLRAQLGPDARVEATVIKDSESRAMTIMKTARNGRYGTVLLGRRGLSRVQQFLMGSVSRKLLQITDDRACWIVC